MGGPQECEDVKSPSMVVVLLQLKNYKVREKRKGENDVMLDT